ncbi:MAG TPA: hypothetical protein VEH05_11340, partial [Streptosporangiaceae bacterium]|nr:hypothetical protein [Streptosporangiaceae bacterium]
PDGYPELLDVPVPFWLQRDAGQAVDMCPTLALTLTKPKPADPPSQPALSSAGQPAAAIGRADRPGRREPRPVAGQGPADRGEPPTLTGRALRRADLEAASAWLAEIGGRRETTGN